MDEIIAALETARNTKGKPTAIIAKTFKGRGIEEIEDKDNWHGKPVPADKVFWVYLYWINYFQIDAIKARLNGSQKGKLVAQKPANDTPNVDLQIGSIKMAPPSYQLGEKVATRAAYGTALSKLGDVNPRVIGLDGDTKNSTFSEKLLKVYTVQIFWKYL